MGETGKRKEKREMLKFYYNLKTKKKERKGRQGLKLLAWLAHLKTQTASQNTQHTTKHMTCQR